MQCKNASSGSGCCYCKPHHSLLAHVAHPLETCGSCRAGAQWSGSLEAMHSGLKKPAPDPLMDKGHPLAACW